MNQMLFVDVGQMVVSKKIRRVYQQRKLNASVNESKVMRCRGRMKQMLSVRMNG